MYKPTKLLTSPQPRDREESFFKTRASAAEKQPEGSNAVDETDPGAQADPSKAPAVEVSDDADPGAQIDLMDPADNVPDWYRAILGSSVTLTNRPKRNGNKYLKA